MNQAPKKSEKDAKMSSTKRVVERAIDLAKSDRKAPWSKLIAKKQAADASEGFNPVYPDHANEDQRDE